MTSGVGIGGWVCLSVARRLVLASIMSGDGFVIVECNAARWTCGRDEGERWEEICNESEVNRLLRYIGNLETPRGLIYSHLYKYLEVRSISTVFPLNIKSPFTKKLPKKWQFFESVLSK